MLPYLTPDAQDKVDQRELLLKDGFQGPLNWYKVVVRGFSGKDNECECPVFSLYRTMAKVVVL